MKKILTSVLFFCVPCISAADVTEIAKLTLTADGQKPLVCVVFMDANADVQVHINGTNIRNDDDIIAAIQKEALTHEAALQLLEGACPVLKKAETHRKLDSNAATAKRPDVHRPTSPATEEDASEPDTF